MSFYNIYCRTYQTVLKLGNFFLGYHMPDYIEGSGCVRQLPELLQKAGIRNVLLVILLNTPFFHT